MQVDLPWPPKELQPNSRCHWRVKAKAGKNYKRVVYYLCKAANLSVEADEKVPAYSPGSYAVFPHTRGAEPVHLWLDFYPPDKRHRDQDNMLASCKFLIDGIAEALQINDVKFVLHPFLHDAIDGKIVVKIGENEGNDA